MDLAKPTLTTLRFRHPAVAFQVDATPTERDGRWLATAMLAGEPDVGTGDDPREELQGALAALGEPFASEMATSAGAAGVQAQLREYARNGADEVRIVPGDSRRPRAA